MHSRRSAAKGVRPPLRSDAPACFGERSGGSAMIGSRSLHMYVHWTRRARSSACNDLHQPCCLACLANQGSLSRKVKMSFDVMRGLSRNVRRSAGAKTKQRFSGTDMGLQDITSPRAQWGGSRVFFENRTKRGNGSVAGTLTYPPADFLKMCRGVDCGEKTGYICWIGLHGEMFVFGF